jgi:predicted phage terminase large subunit-like protein
LKGYPVPLRMRAASNPGGPGHDWVKARFVTGRHPDRVFVPAVFTDNPHIDQAEYRKMLSQLDPVTRRQLEAGDWDVRQEGALAKREWFEAVDASPVTRYRVRYWDMAATMRSAKSDDPDWTVGTLMSKSQGAYYIEHVIREQIGAAYVKDLIRQTARADSAEVTVYWEEEGGASGKILSTELGKALAGFNFQPVRVHKDKVTRAMPLLAQARAGNVRLVRGAWMTEWLDEMCAFPLGAHDDQVDSASGAFAALNVPQYGPPGVGTYV